LEQTLWMGGSMLLKIASRKSDLARLQALLVADSLRKVDSNISIEHLFSASFGDLNPDISLDQMPTKGAFTEDFKEGIKNNEFDIVVHSWKDLPTDLPAHSQLFTLKREDPRDLLLVRKSSSRQLNLKVLTSSPRRIHHIIPFLKDFYPLRLKEIETAEVRGNIPTRLKKLIEGEGDALIIAKAALDRLLSSKLEEFTDLKIELRSYLDQCRMMVLPLSHFPTAAAQGALAIEVNKNNKKVISILEKIHCSDTFKNVKKERTLLSNFGGGCHQKLGMTSLTHQHGNYFSVSGQKPDGKEIKELSLETSLNDSKPETKDEVLKATSFFDRERINVEVPIERDLYLAKDYALPEQFTNTDQIIFTSGVASWKKLADKGHWITGSSESLGEPWGTNLEELLGRELNWLKLSHTKAPGENLSTYELTPKKDLPDLKNKSFFYWMSASQFNLALEKFPEIIDKNHACGPGYTHSEISKKIPANRLEIYLSYEKWYQSKIG
jgi:hydroxymethylbilane synthase